MSRTLRTLWLAHLAPIQGPLVFGIDETVARRHGPRIAAQGLSRDGVRSSRDPFVQALGLRGICLLGWTAIP